MLEMQVQSLVRKAPWSRKWHPAPVFLPEKSYGQWNQVGQSPWGHKELATTSSPTHTPTHIYHFAACDSPLISHLLCQIGNYNRGASLSPIPSSERNKVSSHVILPLLHTIRPSTQVTGIKAASHGCLCTKNKLMGHGG